PHGLLEITTKDGRVIMHDDPGETLVVDPQGTVTHVPNTSSRMAELQGAQQAALSTLSQGMGQQGAAPGGSSTPTFNIQLQVQPINFSQPHNNDSAPPPVTITTPATNPGVIVVPVFKPPPVNSALTADASGPHAITEIFNTTSSTTLDTAPSGALTFTEFTPSTASATVSSITWQGGATAPSGLAAALEGAVSIAMDPG